MSSVSKDLLSHPKILDTDNAVSSSSAYQIVGTPERTNSPGMNVLKLYVAVLLADVEDFYGTVGETGCYFVLVAEEINRADIVRRIHRFVESLHLAQRP